MREIRNVDEVKPSAAKSFEKKSFAVKAAPEAKIDDPNKGATDARTNDLVEINRIGLKSNVASPIAIRFGSNELSNGELKSVASISLELNSDPISRDSSLITAT